MYVKEIKVDEEFYFQVVKCKNCNSDKIIKSDEKYFCQHCGWEVQNE